MGHTGAGNCKTPSQPPLPFTSPLLRSCCRACVFFITVSVCLEENNSIPAASTEKNWLAARRGSAHNQPAGLSMTNYAHLQEKVPVVEYTSGKYRHTWIKRCLTQPRGLWPAKDKRTKNRSCCWWWANTKSWDELFIFISFNEGLALRWSNHHSSQFMNRDQSPITFDSHYPFVLHMQSRCSSSTKAVQQWCLFTAVWISHFLWNNSHSNLAKNKYQGHLSATANFISSF